MVFSLADSSFPVPRILSYNIRSLSFYSTGQRALKRRISIFNALHDFIKDHDIICLQETHLAPTESFALDSLPSCVISRNNADISHGGTIIIDTPNILRFYSPQDIPLVPIANGYVQLRRYNPISSTHKPFQLFNIYFKSGGDFLFNSSLISAMSRVDSSFPTFMCGDFNFIEHPEDSTSSSPSFPPASFLTSFSAFKSKFSLIDPPHASHTFFHLTADPSSPYCWSSRIDRFLLPSFFLDNPIVAPSISTPFHFTNFKIGKDNVDLSFSDHLPIHVTYDGLTHPDANFSIPFWLASSPEFATALRSIWVAPSSYANSYSILLRFKKALFAAAKIAKSQRLSSTSLPLILSQHIALLRLINSPIQDLSRVNLLLNTCPSLASFVVFNEGRWCEEGLLAAIHNLLNAVSSSFAKPHSSNPIKIISDNIPSSRARIGSLRENLDSPEMISNLDRAALTSKFWSKIWSKRSSAPSYSARIDYLRNYPKKINSSLCHDLDLDDILFSIRHSNNSSPGPDGIPFAAWRAAPDLAAPILLAVFHAISIGQAPPKDFNHGLLYLIPKKVTGLISDTRPISVTNCDNRILSASVARILMPIALDFIDPVQKGFLNGRCGADHTIDINEFFYTGVENDLNRFLFLLDTQKAFDSIDHDWIFCVLKHLSFPNWLIRFVKGMLSDVFVSPCFGKTTSIRIPINRGVKQGCPLSPLLFIIAYDPLLYYLSAIPNIQCFAFADDLAITTDSVRAIYPALSVIDAFSAISGLGINKDKSCVIASSPASSSPLIRAELLASPWPDLSLKEKGLHLGILLGRNVTLEEIWSVPMNKALHKLNSSRLFIKSLSLANRILFVNVFIISLFAYVGLFFVLPTTLWNIIRRAISKAIIPFNGGAFSYYSLVCAKELFSLRVALKDVWAFGLSLLAVRSPLFSTSSNYFDLPRINLRSTKRISLHRDAAAVDFWRGHHNEEGSLLHLPKPVSSAIYKIIIHDVFYDEALSHCDIKLRRYFLASPPSTPIMSIIASNMATVSSAPSYFLFHHFSLINNALPFSRRLRHQNHIAVSDVAACFFCQKGHDSLLHVFSECVIISNARASFFKKLDLDLSPFFVPAIKAYPTYFFPRLRNFVSSFLPSTPITSSLAPNTLGAPLGPTFLHGIPPSLIRPILAFNFAVWKFRKPSLASLPVCGSEWLVSRIVELATNCLACFDSRKRKAISPVVSEGKTDQNNHDNVVGSSAHSVAICYTDGSASPNPGLAGAGVSIFLKDSNEVVDAGVSLGVTTNNAAELVALLICFLELLRLFTSKCFKSAVVFCDSRYVIQQCSGLKKPVANRSLVERLRAAFKKVSLVINVKLQWVKGHSFYGGNNRVDRLSKLFASRNSPSSNSEPVCYESCLSIWPFDFPLTSLPLNCFLSCIAPFPWCQFPFDHFSPSVGSSRGLKRLFASTSKPARVDCLREGMTLLGGICPVVGGGSASCTHDPRSGKDFLVSSPNSPALNSQFNFQSKRRKISSPAVFSRKRTNASLPSASLPLVCAKRLCVPNNAPVATFSTVPFYDTFSEPLDFKHSD